MDLQTYEDFIISEERITDITSWLKENQGLEGLFFEGRLINLILPSSLDFKITETDPGFRGDTVKQGTKPAKLEAGAVVQVPLFVEEGTTVRVDTRTGEYVSRV